MAQYSVTTDGDTKTYKDGKKLVLAKDVPENVVKALDNSAPGTVLDEFAEPVNTETDTDESEDETPPAPNADDADSDDEDDDDEDQTTPPVAPAPKPAARKKKSQRTRRAVATSDDEDEDDDEGFGFPRKNGKTLSIFGTHVHETVKYVNGQAVPLTHEEYETKSDADIIEQLKKLGKTA